MPASLAHGLRRLAVIGGIVATSLLVLGVAWALWRGRPVAHAVAVFFYIGAVLVAFAAIGSGGGARGRAMSSRAVLAQQQRRNAELGDNLWFLVLAVLLGAVGALVQSWL